MDELETAVAEPLLVQAHRAVGGCLRFDLEPGVDVAEVGRIEHRARARGEPVDADLDVAALALDAGDERAVDQKAEEGCGGVLELDFGRVVKGDSLLEELDERVGDLQTEVWIRGVADGVEKVVTEGFHGENNKQQQKVFL